MPRISIGAICIAFAAELAADWLISHMLFVAFARDLLTPEMSHEEFAKLVFETTAFVPWMMLFGTATTVGGAYLAARIARRIPYYHGLAMGIAGMVFSLFLWRADARWFDYLGLIITIPVSLFGAHLARRHMPEEP